MDTDDTSTRDPARRCCLCHRTLSSETETRGSLEPMGICDNCNFLFFEDNVPTRTQYNNSLESVENMLLQTDSDSDTSVDVDSYLNHDNDDDDDDDDDENTGESLVGRIQLHRSLAINGRNRPHDWLGEIISDEGITNSERRRLFGILEDYVDVETHGSTQLAAAAWFIKSLEHVVVDEPGSVCVICKDNMCVGGGVNQLPCGHVYHGSCIVPWLSTRNTCPLCRYELPTDDKDRSSEVQVEGVVAESGGRRWWFVGPLVSVAGIVVLWWLGGGVFGGQRDDRSTRWWSLFCI